MWGDKTDVMWNHVWCHEKSDKVHKKRDKHKMMQNIKIFTSLELSTNHQIISALQYCMVWVCEPDLHGWEDTISGEMRPDKGMVVFWNEIIKERQRRWGWGWRQQNEVKLDLTRQMPGANLEEILSGCVGGILFTTAKLWFVRQQFLWPSNLWPLKSSPLILNSLAQSCKN